MKKINGIWIIKWTWYMRNVTAIFLGETKKKDGNNKGAAAQSFAGLPFIIVREWESATDETINHEKIHMRQGLELLYIPFIVMYIGNYIWNLMKGMKGKDAYMNIVFEREAYENQKNLLYLQNRTFWAWRIYWSKYWRDKLKRKLKNEK